MWNIIQLCFTTCALHLSSYSGAHLELFGYGFNCLVLGKIFVRLGIHNFNLYNIYVFILCVYFCWKGKWKDCRLSFFIKGKNTKVNTNIWIKSFNVYSIYRLDLRSSEQIKYDRRITWWRRRTSHALTFYISASDCIIFYR